LKEPLIAVVGVCASGKTTLVAGLTGLGLRAVAISQEHSFVKRLWAKLHPDTDILIMLDARWETTKLRRPAITYGPERLEEQRRRLAHAIAECNLYLPTDDLSIEQVRQSVVDWVKSWKERS